MCVAIQQSVIAKDIMIKLHLEETVKSTHAPLKAKEKATYTSKQTQLLLLLLLLITLFSFTAVSHGRTGRRVFFPSPATGLLN